jgi:hypothetical protein
MRVSLAQAAKASGRSRSTILRTIRSGRLSAERDELTGAWSIDMSELARMFTIAADDGQGSHDHSMADDQLRTGIADTMATRLAAAEARLADAQDQIADLRRRLDAEAEERRRLTALLTDRSTTPAAVPTPEKRRRWWWSRG